MARFEFNLSNEDTERLFFLKNKNGFKSLTGNEYAEKILSKLLFEECPKVPQRDEYGEYVYKD